MDTQDLFKQLAGARESEQSNGEIGRLRLSSGLDIVGGCCLWILCQKNQQLTKQKDIADALNVTEKQLRSKLKAVTGLLESLGLATRYGLAGSDRSTAPSALDHVEKVVSQLVPPECAAIRHRIVDLTKKLVALAEQSSLDTGRHREPLVVAAAVLGLAGYVETEFDPAMGPPLQKRLSPDPAKVASIFHCGKGVLSKRSTELKDLLLEIAEPAGIACTQRTMTPHLAFLIDNAEDYQDMMTITPNVDMPAPSLGSVQASRAAGGSNARHAHGIVRRNGKMKVLDPLGVPPSFEANKRRRIADGARRKKLVDTAIATRDAAAAAAAAVGPSAPTTGEPARRSTSQHGDGAGAGAGPAHESGEHEEISDEHDEVCLLVKLLEHGYTREELLHADLDELNAIACPVQVSSSPNLTDADLPPGLLCNYIKTDEEVLRIEEQKKTFLNREQKKRQGCTE
jgi:hypothetical protein